MFRVHFMDIANYPSLFITAHFDTPTIGAFWASATQNRIWNHSCPIQAFSFEQAFYNGNHQDPRLLPRSISVGDVLEDQATKELYLVAPYGFESLPRPRGACPHDATGTPDTCEFCVLDF